MHVTYTFRSYLSLELNCLHLVQGELLMKLFIDLLDETGNTCAFI